MNKSDLLTVLANTFYHVGDPAQVATFGNLQRYSVQAFDRADDILRAVSVDFYVLDEGQPGETAFWNIRTPSSQNQESFASLAGAYIASKVADGTIVAGFITAMDEANERAVAWAYVTQQANINEVKALLRRSGPGGPITHTVINTVIQTGG